MRFSSHQDETRRRTRRRPRSRARRAFTLIELVLVIGLLALLAGIVAPRLVGNQRRQELHAADAVADLLTLFAHRESVGDSRIAIGHDPAAGAIMLLEMIGDPLDPRNPPQWRLDRWIEPVRLPEGMVVSAVRHEGAALDPASDWLVPAAPGERRPTIELGLFSENVNVLIVLPSHALAAEVLHEGEESRHRLPVDLDALGRDREVW